MSRQIVSMVILSPTPIITMLVLGLVVLRKRPQRGKLLIIGAATALFLLSLPAVSNSLMSLVEVYPALDSQAIKNSKSQAIVILSAGWNEDAKEYKGDTVDKNTLERIRYGAYLHRLTGLPVLVTGGDPIGELMAMVLRNDYQIEPNWIENQSRNTAENAAFSKELLEKDNISHIFLVTHAWHMARSYAMFTKYGLSTMPAPTAFDGWPDAPMVLSDFIPSTSALQTSYSALHEIIGYIWYKIHYL